MTKKTWQVVLAGTGGQGLVLGGIMLAKVAVFEEKNVVQTQTYGIQNRGGYSHAEVLISEGTIYFPKCDNPDLVLALGQEGFERFRNKVSKNCIILYDQDLVTVDDRENFLGYPFKRKAIELGDEKVINSLALGAILKICPAVSKENMAKVLQVELPEKVFNLNLKAFELGFEEIDR